MHQESGNSESQKAEDTQSELAELVQRALLQIGGMNDIQDRLKEVSARISRVTKIPPPTNEN